jgi:hypothetical protein
MFVLASLLVPIVSLGVLAQSPSREQAPPTTDQLITRALEAKEIDEETAYTYYVFGAFGDSRLPAKYRGTDSGREPSPKVAEAASKLSAFTANTQSQLAPFFARPNAPSSWINLPTVSNQQASSGPSNTPAPAPTTPTPVSTPTSTPASAAGVIASSSSGWRTFSTVGGRVKVWSQNRYPGDDAKAEALAAALPYIWKKLNDLMAPEPVSDASLPNNGGDGALDIYLVHAPTKIVNPKPNTPNVLWNGYAASSEPANGCHPARYLLVDSKLPLKNPGDVGILDVTAHELMHAIQFAYKPCPDLWLRESTATWAEHFVYPENNSEHVWAGMYLAIFNQSIRVDQGEYRAYLFSYFEQMATKGADFMPLLWEGHKTKDALRAFNDVLAGGWDGAWPEFLAQSWNRAPVDTRDGYLQKDKIFALPKPEGNKIEDVTVTAGIKEYPITLPPEFDLHSSSFTPGLAHLAGAFFHYRFRNNVRAVSLSNTIAKEGIPHASVWGIEKIKGKWNDPVPYTKDFDKYWCRDNSKEDLEELVLVFGNSDWQTFKPLNPKQPPLLKAYSSGCPDWVGTTSMTLTLDLGYGTLIETVNAEIEFALDTAYIVPGERPEYWQGVSGKISWTMTLRGGQCSGSDRGSFPIKAPAPGEDDITRLRMWVDGDSLAYNNSKGPWPDRYEPKLEYRCKDAPTIQAPLLSSGGWWVMPTMPPPHMALDAKTFSGVHRIIQPKTTMDFKWSFHMLNPQRSGRPR